MDANKREITQIFTRGKDLRIPFFQRTYVWGKDEWERFLDDMRSIRDKDEEDDKNEEDDKKLYFFGSVILKKESQNELTVIDGQQRLTTLNIFAKVLCLKEKNDNYFTETFKKRGQDKSIILLHNRNNKDSFDKVVNYENLEDIYQDIDIDIEKDKDEKNDKKINKNIEKVIEKDRILGAYYFFMKNIKEEDNIDFLEKIFTYVVMVVLELSKDEDEQQIFDTLNSLGVRLTTAELLKNYFFKRTEIEEYERYWRPVFEEEQQEYWDKEITVGRSKKTMIDAFFHAYLQIKIQDKSLKVNTKDKDAFSKIDNLFQSYKNFMDKYMKNRLEVIKEIKEYAKTFRENFDDEAINTGLTRDSGMHRINVIIFGLETSTLIPYILYILKNVNNEDERNQLFDCIEAYIMRRIVVQASSKNYNQFFVELIFNKINSKEKFKNHLDKKEDTVNYLPDDNKLEEGFNKSTLINNLSKGIIYFIESKIRNKKQSTALLSIKSYQLEHLMPKKWERNWKLENKGEKEERNFQLKTLGNLAIINKKLNKSIQDANWKDKKKGKNKKGGLNDYSAGIETLARFLEKEEWNEKEISERAKFLYEKALKIWSLDDE